MAEEPSFSTSPFAAGAAAAASLQEEEAFAAAAVAEEEVDLHRLLREKDEEIASLKQAILYQHKVIGKRVERGFVCCLVY